MMQEATNRSVMFAGRSIELGLFNNPSLGNTFADIASFTGVPPQRTGRDYELKYMPGGSVPSFNKTARAWLMRGVIREDDGGTLASWKKGEPFTDDPFGKFNRFCSHFYDPWFDRALEGYSAGVMDYFFRGKVQIELPPEQVYAVEDFSTWIDANAGFKQLKIMVKNSTLDIGSARQLTASQGHLYAVLRFRRNRCLEYPTLNGAPYRDYSDGQLLWDNTCRTPGVQLQPFPEIIVSDRINAPADFDNSLQEVVFTFPNPLPFNATDVDLQVVYRGKLGTENNAVAVGLEHISEPNFFNIDNNSDCLKGIATCPYGDTSSNCSFNPTLRLPFPNLTQPGSRPVASVNLGAGEYARVVFLTRTAYREDLGGGSFDEVLKNQEFPYTVIVTWIPGGDTETWLPGQQISYFGKNRRLTTGSGPMDSFGHRGWGIYGSDCGGRSCGGFEWAATQCTPIPAQPKQVTVMFPNP